MATKQPENSHERKPKKMNGQASGDAVKPHTLSPAEPFYEDFMQSNVELIRGSKRLQLIIKDYERITGLKLTFREVSEEENIVSRVKPAAVMGDGSIVVLQGIEIKILEDAIAHELKHKMLAKNIVMCRANESRVLRENSFDLSKDDDFDKFDTIMTRLESVALCINDALSHKTLIQELESEYGISSEEHLTLLSQCLDYSEFIATCSTAAIEDYHAHGLVLFDLEQTMPVLIDKITAASKLHPEIEKAFLAGKEYLQPITNGSDMSNQRNKVIQFLRVLGYADDTLQYSEVK